MKQIRRNRAGQGMTEYIIIVALVAIASIAVVNIFGDSIRELFSASTKNIQGTPTDPKAGKDPSGEVTHSLKDL